MMVKKEIDDTVQLIEEREKLCKQFELLETAYEKFKTQSSKISSFGSCRS